MMNELSTEIRQQLVEAAAKSEYDWDTQRSDNWLNEDKLVRAIYVDRARRWFVPVLKNYDE